MPLFLCVIGTCFHWQEGNWLVTLTFIACFSEGSEDSTHPSTRREGFSLDWDFIRSAKPLRFLCASLSVNFSMENVHTFY